MKHIHNLPHLKQKRRELRNNSTLAEIRLWKHLKNKQIEGRKFRRQHSIGNFIIDFYCPQEALAIEIDGSAHENIVKYEYGLKRTGILESAGINVIRFTNDEIFEDLENVILKIKNCFEDSTTPTPPIQEGIEKNLKTNK